MQSSTIYCQLCKHSFKSISILLLSLFIQHAWAQSDGSSIKVDAMYGTQSRSNNSLKLTGTVEAQYNAQLSPLAAGSVEQILIEVGDTVKKDQVLLRLNSKLIDLEVAGAKANVNALQINALEAQRLFKEATALSEKQVVPQTLISERRALVANAQAQLTRAQAQLSLQNELAQRHTLRAPFDGVIAQRNVDVGEWISQQSEVFNLVADNNMRLTVAIPQEYYNVLARQENVIAKVFLEANSTNYINAQISRFIRVTDPITRAFNAQIDLPVSASIAVGMSASAHIVIPNTLSTTVILPRSAIKQHPDGGSSVFVVENGKAKRIITPYTALLNNMVSIANQPANALYILTGIELLRDGTPVNVTITEGAR